MQTVNKYYNRLFPLSEQPVKVEDLIIIILIVPFITAAKMVNAIIKLINAFVMIIFICLTVVVV